MLEALRRTEWSTTSDKVRFRILANLGAAHHNLGAYDKAAAFFHEAYAYNPNEPISIANYTAGLRIKNRRDEAQALAKESLPKFPDSIDLALQRLQARAPNEDVEQLWPELPPKTRERPEMLLFRVGALREADDARWRDVIDTTGFSAVTVVRSVVQARMSLTRRRSSRPPRHSRPFGSNRSSARPRRMSAPGIMQLLPIALLDGARMPHGSLIRRSSSPTLLRRASALGLPCTPAVRRAPKQ